ncbi:CD44 antigen isoform X13 [Macaca thibetana thibetana]|uniref:CD44 antigen isoform X13 n=1 Tax=Macaca mulatta TaxID=9544 RepID=UPI0000D9D91C|nr:CD44 antigen isoform X13 [Macaca mulatta]XP_005578261.1 CD44 antigen isoform X14 [Macaca fascicularis]XP_050614703.1 CD44 antigen isoform X13 [Macaca thibetana thibetana]
MDKFRWHAAWGLCLLQLSLAQIDLNITCRFAGVFHVEKNGRYSISRTEAADLCKAFNSTLPTMAQMEKALSVGFETCRYGFIEGHVVIPRIQPNSICAANHTGVYILTSNTSQYDTYCFNASAPPKEDCTSVTDLPNAFDGPITITIVNPDGTRYIKKGEYRTNPEDIYPSNPTDDDVSSGSSSERSSTSGGYIFHTFSTAHPIPDEDGPWITDSTDRIPATNMDSSHSTTLQPTADPNTGLVEDLDRTGPLSMTTKQSNSQSFSTSHEGLEEDKDHPTTSTLTSSNRNDVTGGRRDPNHSEGSTTLLEGYTSHYPDTKESRTFIPVTSAKTGSFGVTEVTVGDSNSNVNHSLSGDQDAFYPSGGSHTTHGSESAGHSHGSQEGGANTTSGPVRTPQIPEWLIILASLLALALILAVCIAVNSRRRCGQKKKLVINSGNGAVDDRKPSGLNGEASKSQEMVHLVNKEPSETPDQFMTADETRNLQNVDMKIGV